MMYVKIHKSGDRHVVAICDENLIGKSFSEGKLILKITERFYKGISLNEEETYEIMKNALNLNLVGEKTINLALKNDLIPEENVKKIKGIPHAQVYQLE